MTDTTTTITTGATLPPTAVIMGPGELVGPVLPEPGWKTSEMWLTLIPIGLGVLLTSGLFADGSLWAKLIGAAIAMFSAFGYGVQRAAVKSAASKAGVTVMATPAPARSTTRASLVALVAVALGAGVLQPACGTPAVVTGGAVVIDCLAQDQAQLMELVGSLWAVFTSSGSWKDVENSAIAAGKDLGGCALAEVVQHYLAPPKGRAAPAGEQGRAARAALEDFRTTQANGATFHTAAGNL